jgi:hypothetical protein
MPRWRCSINFQLLSLAETCRQVSTILLAPMPVGKALRKGYMHMLVANAADQCIYQRRSVLAVCLCQAKRIRGRYRKILTRTRYLGKWYSDFGSSARD